MCQKCIKGKPGITTAAKGKRGREWWSGCHMEGKKWSKESISGDSIKLIKNPCVQTLFAVNWILLRLGNPKFADLD